MKQPLNELTIFSVYSGLDNDKDKTHHELVKKFLLDNDLKFESVIGVYKGQREQSFLVSHDPNNVILERTLITEITKKYKQESILVANEQRQAKLVYMNEIKDTTDLGILIQCDNDNKGDSYTITSVGMFRTLNKNGEKE